MRQIETLLNCLLCVPDVLKSDNVSLVEKYIYIALTSISGFIALLLLLKFFLFGLFGVFSASTIWMIIILIIDVKLVTVFHKNNIKEKLK